jgi:hypothetical protein
MIAELLPLMVSLLAQSVIAYPPNAPVTRSELAAPAELPAAQAMQHPGLSPPLAGTPDPSPASE